MNNRAHPRRNRAVVGAGIAITSLAGLALATPASAATNAVFVKGLHTLTVIADQHENTITVSRDAAGVITVNGGEVAVHGTTATVDNTDHIVVVGGYGDDRIALDETNGPLPAASIFGGAGDDTLIGGSGADQLFGQSGDDVLLGKAGDDVLYGGDGNDVLTGGVGTDESFGGAGDDQMVWNPGEGSDVNEGGAGSDTVVVNGGNVGENFTVTANGARVRFDRVNPLPFSLDIGSSEQLVLNANGGDDSFATSGDIATLISLSVDGGAGNDRIAGGDGNDVLLGGDGNDSLFGRAGDDVLRGGNGDDVLDGGPGQDVLDGGAGTNVLTQ